MAHPRILRQLQAQGQADAMETLERLLPEESELIRRARRDVSSTPEFQTGVTVIELTRIVADQQRRIEELEKALREPSGAKTKAKK